MQLISCFKLIYFYEFWNYYDNMSNSLSRFNFTFGALLKLLFYENEINCKGVLPNKNEN